MNINRKIIGQMLFLLTADKFHIKYFEQLGNNFEQKLPRTTVLLQGFIY